MWKRWRAKWIPRCTATADLEAMHCRRALSQIRPSCMLRELKLAETNADDYWISCVKLEPTIGFISIPQESRVPDAFFVGAVLAGQYLHVQAGKPAREMENHSRIETGDEDLIGLKLRHEG